MCIRDRCTSNPYDNNRVAGTVGLPLPGIQLRIADDKGNEVEQGQIGIIELKGENVFKGYWQMPDKTSESFREDGFFITGDMAKVDDNGFDVHILVSVIPYLSRIFLLVRSSNSL